MNRLAFAAALLLCAAPAAAVPTQPQAEAPASPEEQLRGLVQEIRATMLRTGEVVPGWNVGGADPDAALRAKGADTHYFLIDDGGSREVSILSDKRIDTFAPGDWRQVDSYGSPVAYAEKPSIAFAALSSRYAVGLRGDGYRANDVDCSKKITHAILYEDPDAPDDGTDRDSAIGLFRVTLLAMDGQEICTRSQGNAETGWTARYMLPDGRDLPELNSKKTHMTIVPAAPVDTLIKAAPAEPPPAS